MNKTHLFLLGALLLIGCSPSVTVKEYKTGAYPALSATAPVDVLNVSDNVPSPWIRLGEGDFGDTGFTMGCDLEKMTGLARRSARAMGADALKIIEHKTPDLLSSCHRIKVVYYRKVESESGAVAEQESSAAGQSQEKTSAVTGQSEIPVTKPKNTTAVGYQIGGTTLIGIDHEIRIADQFGVHFGGGLAGFGGGFRLHTGPETHSGYFDVNYKDGGFGLFETLAFQYGGFVKMGSSSGLRYEIGIQKILFIEEKFEDKLFNDKKAPPFIFALGLGWAW